MDEDEAALLAELRAISNKSAAATRFQDEQVETSQQDAREESNDMSFVSAKSSTSMEDFEDAVTGSAKKSRHLFEGTSPDTKTNNAAAPSDTAISTLVPVQKSTSSPPPPTDTNETVQQTFGIKSSLPSTFQGDRGGAAEDEELLAELRAISQKSSSADRFAGQDKDNGGPTSVVESVENVVVSTPKKTAADRMTRPSPKASSNKKSNDIPPWKRGKKNAKPSAAVKVDIVVAAPPTPSKEKDTDSSSGKAVESVVASPSTKNTAEPVSRPSPKAPKAASVSELISWKRSRKVAKSPTVEVDVVVASAPSEQSAPAEPDAAAPQKFGIQDSTQSTFQGDRGGAAEDAELLAELRAISAKSSGADRFANESNGNGETAEPKENVLADSSSKKSTSEGASRSEVSKQKTDELPPWKRGKKMPTKAAIPDVDIVVAAPPTSSQQDNAVETDESKTAPPTLGIKTSLPSTFQGDRGGAAEDEELLAELRAISAKSTGANRFSEDNQNGGVSDTGTSLSRNNAGERAAPSSSSSPKTPTPESGQLPPWKRGKKKSESAAATGTVDVVVAAPAPKPASALQEKKDEPISGGIHSSGDRGGPAEDAELLAELRAVSNRPKSGIKSDLPSTFRGERGGAAEDAELLAELRAISSASSTGNQPSTMTSDAQTFINSSPFSQSRDAGNEASQAVAVVARAPTSESAPPLPHPVADGDAPSVTSESLPAAVKDKSWKLRKEAYTLLSSLLADRLKNGEGNGSINGETLMPGLDDALPAIVSDSNAGALDTALAFAVDYAEHCSGASSSELAAKIVTGLIKGSALSSSRPTTSKSATALTLKLMEVGDNGNASVHAVSEILLSQGISSRKPKVVIATSALILQAAYDFGAGSLPLAAISSTAPKMLSHSNATVRETGLKIIAEICRALGSKSPLESLIDGMKKAQLSQLDTLLEEQPEPTPIGVGLRSLKGSASSQSPTDALAALEAGAKDLEAKRFAEREPVNIFQELPKTDYSSRVKLPKWSEKVAALDIILQCGGAKPYKLVQPSSSANYQPLINEMKKLLSHSHFAVASKSMQVLSMLAEGVGSSLFSNLRPLLGQLILLSKDKKLNRAVGECLDVFFGNVLDIEHLLDEDNALPSALNEKLQKNALVRASALNFLGRCINRGESAGTRGRISPKSAAAAARLCCEKLEDSDASVRKAATETLSVLLSVEDAAIADAVSPIIESLQTKNSRAYKSLTGSVGGTRKRVGTSSSSTVSSNVSRLPKPGPPKPQPLPRGSVTTTRPLQNEQPSTKPSTVTMSRQTQSSSRTASVADVQKEDATESPTLTEAISILASSHIPSWDAPEDDGGVLAGLKSSKWLLRQNAILNLAAYSKLEESRVSSTDGLTAALVVVVKEHTKGFRETNVNVTKAVMELFMALSEAHARDRRVFPGWACRDAVTLAVEKIADKKLSALSCKLLSDLCCVRPPQGVVEYGISRIDNIKSPLGHEAFLKWLKDFLSDFGASTIAGALKNIVPWLLKECEASNPKVRKTAMSVAGDLHQQLGPAFRALILSSCGDAGSTRSQLECTFDERPFDPAASQIERPRTCVVLSSNSTTESNGDAAAVLVDLPKMDLAASLPSDCIEKMGTKEGKNAWKLRKEALDQVEASVKKSNGLISTEALKPLVELLRALRERLSDSQSNLKPVAARIIGSILGSVDTGAQAKLGKIVFSPLVSAVANDNRKPMREASLEAIRAGTTASSIEGGEPNTAALESLMVAVVGELSESEFKAGGLPDVLVFITGVAEFLPNLDSIASARAQTLGDKFGAVMVACLTSSKAETRSAAEKLLMACIENDKLSLNSVKKGMKHLLPAQQRTVIPIVARLPHPTHPASPTGGKENSIPSPPRGARQRKPPGGVSAAASSAASPRQRPRPDFSTRIEGKAKPVPPAQAETVDHDDSHPLIAIGEAGKRPLPPSRRINWPEHPEEPNSIGQLNALKKIWSRSLPSRSIHALFPSGGIKKQEDAMSGCALLCKAIEKDRAGKEEAIVDHIDVIFMWTSFALCSRESTVGLQSLITLLTRLFTFLEDHQYQLSDSEAFILLPHIFEKASIAKGRFRKQFNNVIAFFRSDTVISTRSLGQVICVPLIEHSHQSKTRVLALHECQACVDRIGLSGIGKKGLLVTAKALSDESLPENRSAALDLMETVLAKMDGDVDKLASICGTAYLSDKGRALIEEQCKKHSGSQQSLAQKSQQRDARARRQSQIPSSRMAAGTSRSRSRTAPPTAESFDASPSPNKASVESFSRGGFRDELPSFDLHFEDSKSTAVNSIHKGSTVPEGPFTFSFKPAELSPRGSEPSADKDEEIREDTVSDTMLGRTTVQSSKAASSNVTGPPTEGAAASLRARLLKIREKQKEEYVPASSTSALHPELSPSDTSSPLTEPLTAIINKEECETGEGHKTSQNSYDTLHTCVEELLHTKPPVPEAHPRVRDCTAALKKYHAAISNQPGAAPDMSYTEFSDLRQRISEKTVETIENLTSVFVFAFDCEFPENTAGMSIPLLSVALATLMALFRDSGLSQHVTQDALALLIREAGKALLDPRLAMSSHHAMASQLDESTSSQMVRAINKLAVQAATGSPRDVSIEALLALQLQLCTVGNDTAADAAFNSRLSRIVTKLFAKVLKAEASSVTPFAPETVDVEAIICALEDMLVATAFAPGAPNRNRQDAIETCSNMGRALLIPIINSRGQGGLEEIRAMMDELGIDSRESKLALLVTSCESELDYSSNNAQEEVKRLASAPSSPARKPSMNIATLVAELGSAPEGPERLAAVAALRRYNELHGKAELHDHLRDVSETFRAYIMEQLEESLPTPERPRAVGESNEQSLPMSERIRFLRSKLNATEAAVQSAVGPPDAIPKSTVQTEQENTAAEVSQPTTPSRRIPEPSTPSRRTASEARSTPSRIPKPTSSATAQSTQTSTAALSLRERLAAAQKNRAKAAAESESSEDVLGRGTSAYGHAAALRARLEKVKQQSKRDLA